jgi:hypothetical protein
VIAELTVWTNGQLLWCTHQGKRHSWPVSDIGTAVARLAALATGMSDGADLASASLHSAVAIGPVGVAAADLLGQREQPAETGRESPRRWPTGRCRSSGPFNRGRAGGGRRRRGW